MATTQSETLTYVPPAGQSGAGVTITAVSADPSVATVSPSSAVTTGTGPYTVGPFVVTRVAAGNTVVTFSGGSATCHVPVESQDVPVFVPTGTLAGDIAALNALDSSASLTHLFVKALGQTADGTGAISRWASRVNSADAFVLDSGVASGAGTIDGSGRITAHNAFVLASGAGTLPAGGAGWGVVATRASGSATTGPLLSVGAFTTTRAAQPSGGTLVLLEDGSLGGAFDTFGVAVYPATGVATKGRTTRIGAEMNGARNLLLAWGGRDLVNEAVRFQSQIALLVPPGDHAVYLLPARTDGNDGGPASAGIDAVYRYTGFPSAAWMEGLNSILKTYAGAQDDTEDLIVLLGNSVQFRENINGALSRLESVATPSGFSLPLTYVDRGVEGIMYSTSGDPTAIPTCLGVPEAGAPVRGQIPTLYARADHSARASVTYLAVEGINQNLVLPYYEDALGVPLMAMRAQWTARGVPFAVGLGTPTYPRFGTTTDNIAAMKSGVVGRGHANFVGPRFDENPVYGDGGSAISADYNGVHPNDRGTAGTSGSIHDISSLDVTLTQAATDALTFLGRIGGGSPTIDTVTITSPADAASLADGASVTVSGTVTLGGSAVTGDTKSIVIVSGGSGVSVSGMTITNTSGGSAATLTYKLRSVKGGTTVDSAQRTLTIAAPAGGGGSNYPALNASQLRIAYRHALHFANGFAAANSGGSSTYGTLASGTLGGTLAPSYSFGQAGAAGTLPSAGTAPARTQLDGNKNLSADPHTGSGFVDDTIWTGSWAIIATIDVDAATGDTTSNHCIANKQDAANPSDETMNVRLSSGALFGEVVFTDGTYVARTANTALAAGTHRVAVRYDATQTNPANRITLYVDGAVVASTASGNAGSTSTSPVNVAAAPFRLGAVSGIMPGLIGGVGGGYLYAGALTDADVLTMLGQAGTLDGF